MQKQFCFDPVGTTAMAAARFTVRSAEGNELVRLFKATKQVGTAKR